MCESGAQEKGLDWQVVSSHQDISGVKPFREHPSPLTQQEWQRKKIQQRGPGDISLRSRKSIEKDWISRRLINQ